jgi:hypothetical protein
VRDLAKHAAFAHRGYHGSGKSVAINAMVLSLLYKSTAEHVRLIMIDPKMLELSVYEGIPHLLAPVVTDMKHAANALALVRGGDGAPLRDSCRRSACATSRASIARSKDATMRASRFAIR